MRLFKSEAFATSRPNDPRFVPGNGSSIIPSPSKSLMKISAAPQSWQERKTDCESGDAMRVVVFRLIPHGNVVNRPKLNWWVRSKPAGPKNFVGASLNADPERKS